jgi:transposase
MIALSPQARIFVYSESIDFRNGLDGLIGLVKTRVKEDPFGGAVFVFRNRRSTAFKAIAYDGQGYWLFMKRLSEGRFMHWPRASGEKMTAQLLARELTVLFWNGDPGRASMKSDWRTLAQ